MPKRAREESAKIKTSSTGDTGEDSDIDILFTYVSARKLARLATWKDETVEYKKIKDRSIVEYNSILHHDIRNEIIKMHNRIKGKVYIIDSGCGRATVMYELLCHRIIGPNIERVFGILTGDSVFWFKR